MVEFAPALWHLALRSVSNIPICVWLGSCRLPVQGLLGWGPWCGRPCRRQQGHCRKLDPWHFLLRSGQTGHGEQVRMCSRPPAERHGGYAAWDRPNQQGWLTPLAWAGEEADLGMLPARAGSVVDPGGGLALLRRRGIACVVHLDPVRRMLAPDLEWNGLWAFPASPRAIAETPPAIHLTLAHRIPLPNSADDYR